MDKSRLPPRCYHCKLKINDILQHLLNHHRDQSLSILRPIEDNSTDTVKYRALHYPHLCHEINATQYSIDTNTWRLEFRETTDTRPGTSVINMAPCSFSSRREESHVAKCLISDIELNVSLDSTLEYGDDMGVDDITQEMNCLLPKVVEHLRAGESLDRWSVLMRLLAQGKFPTDNLCFHLCLDVAQWYATDKTTQMRYTDQTKRFWALGYKLFKEKFLRFMGGYKNVGQIMGDMAQKGHTTSSQSKINLVVPDVKVLRKEISQLDCCCERPGVLLGNIKLFKDLIADRSCKICIDGKKINCGFGKRLGEVDMYGHETHPTLKEQECQKKDELKHVDDIENFISKLYQRCITTISGATHLIDDEIMTRVRQLIHILTLRIKELAQLKVKKGIALRNLRKTIGDIVTDSRILCIC